MSAGKHDYVFCETCNRLAQVLFKLPLLKTPPKERYEQRQQLQAAPEKGQLEVLEDMPVTTDDIQPGDYARLILWGCDHCHDFYCADVIRVAAKCTGGIN
jgi:hypothetical protein